jgi:hypothetical protein
MSNQSEYLEPWVATGEYADNLVKELEREVTEGHALWKVKTRAIAQRSDSDDVLFEIECQHGKYAVVHLTWSGEPEPDARWPDTRIFATIDSWAEECMKADHAKFIGSGD